MYATIRIYRNASSKHEVARRVEEEFIPALRDSPGFRGWYVIDGGNGTFASVTFFDTLEDTLALSDKAAAWIRDSDVARMLPEAAEVTAGEVLRFVVP